MTQTLHLTSISLRVADLARSVAFYTERLGFAVSHEAADFVQLSASADSGPLLTLLDGRDAAPPPRNAAGLFHAALLLPSRHALASWLNFAAAQGLEFEGFSDHGVSEAIYLSDPDGNGLEFYADRPCRNWPYVDGELAMTTRPLAIRSLLAAASPTTAPLAGAAWGHLHLRVTDLDQSEAFYRETLGLELTQGSYPGARFLAADGYHHHIGLNTWGGPTLPQPNGARGLADATFAREGFASIESVNDPDGITIRITAPLAAPIPAPAV